MISTSTVPSQERLTGALAYLFFWIPVLMKVKTEFTIFHMKQSFIFHILIVIAFLLGHIWLIGGFMKTILIFIWLIFGGWSSYQAYLGSRFTPPYFGEYTNTVITKLGLTSIFTK